MLVSGGYPRGHLTGPADKRANASCPVWRHIASESENPAAQTLFGFKEA